MRNRFFIFSFITLLLFAVAPATVFGEQWAVTLDFKYDSNDPNYTPDNSFNSGGSKLNLVITTLGPNYDLRFTFFNSWKKDYSITQISFNESNLTEGSSSFLNYSNYYLSLPKNENVDFSPSSEAGNSVDFSSSNVEMGIGQNESVSFKFNFTDPNTEDIFSLVKAIGDGSVSIGLSVQSSIGSGGGSFMLSDNNIEGPYAVPEPATLFLLVSGLVGVAGMARRRSRKYS